MTAAQDAPYIGDLTKVECFEIGYQTAREELTPLIEAARAYRDAHAAYTAYYSFETYEPARRAESALLAAARTFEAGHEGETG